MVRTYGNGGQEMALHLEEPQNGTKAGSFRKDDKGTICSPANEKTPLNCMAESPEGVTRICFCKGTEDVYKLAPRGSNVCPDQYRAIESSKDCEEAAKAGMQGGPEAEPSCKFTALEDEVFLGGVSYDKAKDGSSAITFMPPGVFQMETKMPFGITQIKLISDKNTTCKIKGKNYKLQPMAADGSRWQQMAADGRGSGWQLRSLKKRAEFSSAFGSRACTRVRLVLDNVLHLEPGFVFVKTLAKNELAHVATISEEARCVRGNRVPALHPAERFIFYRRLTNTDTYEPFKSLACNWNRVGKLVELQDALADNNPWDFCGLDGGRMLGWVWVSVWAQDNKKWTAAQTGQANFIPVSDCVNETDNATGKAVTFELLEDEEMEVEELQAEAMKSFNMLQMRSEKSGETCATAVTEGSREAEWQHVAFAYDLDRFAYAPDEFASLMIGAYKGNARWIGAMKDWQGDVAIYAETLSTALIGRLAGELAAMVWFSYMDGWNQQSYVEAVSFCVKRHMKLARFEDYCILKDGNYSINPHVAPGDQWAPFAGVLMCRMNCIKLQECRFASWTESADGDATCSLFSSCSGWSESETSITWMKKPLG
eukprot:Skav234188  [mRNA]  locus=scaffold1413:64199:84537:+ [translate_table: standard]